MRIKCALECQCGQALSLFLQVQQPWNQALLYANVCHSDNRQAAAPPAEPEKVVYADVSGKTTDKTTEDSVCTGKVSSNVKDGVLSVVHSVVCVYSGF